MKVDGKDVGMKLATLVPPHVGALHAAALVVSCHWFIS